MQRCITLEFSDEYRHRCVSVNWRGEYLPDLCRPLFYDYRLRLVRKMMSGECRRRDKGVFLSRGRLLASVHHEDIR